jgi:hypothetical protein
MTEYRFLEKAKYRAEKQNNWGTSELAGSMLRTLEAHTSSDFRGLFMGDESWMFCECPRKIVWVASWV